MIAGAFSGPTRRAMIAGSAALLAAGAARAAGDPVVTCRAGRFVGARQAGIAVFRGIRYGRAERFRAPAAAPVMREAVRATEPGPACPQRGKRRPQAEDCLFLNIWTPAAGSGARLPVMVWIHGGGYAFGSANDPITDGHGLAAAGDVVVVTVNHRLNAFGYLYLARLDAAFPDSGNAGQLDLVLALQWVRDNIAAFGGDPARVTLIGQSGGGAKIATLMAMSAARGLFRRAITMSGQQVTVSGPVHATRRACAYLATGALGRVIGAGRGDVLAAHRRGSVEQGSRLGHGHQRHYLGAAARLAEQHHPRGIAPKPGDIVPHPSQRQDDIEIADIARFGRAAELREIGVTQPGQTMVERDHDDVAAPH